MMRPDEMERISKTLHVGGISGLGEEIKENDVADFFGQHGEVVGVRISGRFCWVEFADVRAAHTALALDGETTGGHHLRISQSKSAIHSNGLRTARTQAAAPGGGGDGLDSLTPEQKAAALANMQAAALAAVQPAGAYPAPGGYPGYPPQAYYPPPYGAPPPPYGYPPAASYGAPAYGAYGGGAYSAPPQQYGQPGAYHGAPPAQHGFPQPPHGPPPPQQYGHPGAYHGGPPHGPPQGPH